MSERATELASVLPEPTICDMNCFYERGHKGPHQFAECAECGHAWCWHGTKKCAGLWCRCPSFVGPRVSS